MKAPLPAGLLALAALLPAAQAAPSIYTCRDDSGRTITADRPVPECARQPLRELRPDGALRREHAAPPTPAQLREREAMEARQRDAAHARREHELRDRALLQAWPDEGKLEMARRRALEGLQAERAATAARMVARHAQLREAQRTQARAPEDPDARRKVQDIAAAILADDARLAAQRDEMAATVARFDADRERLRALLGRAPSPLSPPPASSAAAR